MSMEQDTSVGEGVDSVLLGEGAEDVDSYLDNLTFVMGLLEYPLSSLRLVLGPSSQFELEVLGPSDGGSTHSFGSHVDVFMSGSVVVTHDLIRPTIKGEGWDFPSTVLKPSYKEVLQSMEPIPMFVDRKPITTLGNMVLSYL